jgi:hypothetical protein
MCSVEWCQAHEVDQCMHGARHEAVIGEITRRDRSMIAVRPDRADFWQYDGPCGDAESTTEITLVGESDQPPCLDPDDPAALIPVLRHAVELARSA